MPCLPRESVKQHHGVSIYSVTHSSRPCACDFDDSHLAAALAGEDILAFPHRALYEVVHFGRVDTRDRMLCCVAESSEAWTVELGRTIWRDVYSSWRSERLSWVATSDKASAAAVVAIRGRGDWEKLPAQEHQAGPSQLRIHAVGSRGWLPVGGWVCAVGRCSRGDVVGDARSVEMAWDEDYVVGEDRRQRGRGGL